MGINYLSPLNAIQIFIYLVIVVAVITFSR